MATNGQVHTEGKAGMAEEKCIIRNTARITPPRKKPSQTQQLIKSQKGPEKGCHSRSKLNLCICSLMHFTALRLRFLFQSHLPISDMKNKMTGRSLVSLRRLVSFSNTIMILCDLGQIM